MKKIYNKTYNINSKLNKNIVLISDLHYSNKEDLDRLNLVLKSIKKLNPNFICIPGDIINESKILDEDLFIEWLKKLSNISKVIISIGNHEFYINKGKKIFGLNKEFFNKISSIDNVSLLNNENIIIDNINFIGITIPMDYYFDEKNKLEGFKSLIDKLNINKKLYNILLCHSPINICYKDNLKDSNIDLVLCGHMHGGVVFNFLRPIFKNRGIISPHKKLFPKNVYGHIKIENTDVIITSGVKVLPYKNLTKLFKPEVVNINLTFNKKRV